VLVRRLLNSLLYFPSRAILETPAERGLPFRELIIPTPDGPILHGWWVAAQRPAVRATGLSPDSPAGHVLLCHGNAGNIGDRVLHAALLSAIGLDVLLFDYRGYGRSTGSPTEEGTYVDARAALEALLAQPEAEPGRVLYLGESLGGAVALELALEHPPAGLILHSTFTSVRDMARLHYPVIPPGVVPDAYPSLVRIATLAAPLLVLHGDRDEIVPVEHGRALFAAAPEPKRVHVFPGLGHNDLVPLAGRAYAEPIADWLRELGLSPR
jgi:fermentation-respiration switch protein FrsA (DUF1100 family)